jgi:hypothetical protein
MSCSALVYDQPVDNELGKHGVAFPVGYVLFIDSADNVYRTTSITDPFDQHTSEAGNPIKAGSGDQGFAVFRRGITYTITAGERTLIDAAGYSACTSA